MYVMFLPLVRLLRADSRNPAPGAARLPEKPAGLYFNMWRHADGARIKLGLTWLMLVGAALLELLSPWLGARALDALQTGGVQALPSAALYGAGILAAALAAWSLHGPGRVFERRIALRVRRQFADRLYARLMQLPLAWHHGHHSAELQQRISQASLALHNFTQSQFQYIKAVVHFLGAVAAILIFSPMLGLVALVGYGLVGLVMVRFDFVLMRLAQEENAAERRYQSRMLDFLGNISSLIAFRMQDSARRMVDDRLEKVFVPARRSITLVEIKWCIADLSSVALTWGLVGFAVWMSRHDGRFMVGGIFLVHQYAQQARSVVLALADKFQTVTRYRSDLASADAIWQAAGQPSRGAPVPGDWRNIDVSGLCYEHAAAGVADHGHAPAPALKSAALNLARGERIALVGPSGAGKSTLMRVLAGHYQGYGQRVEIDGEAPAHDVDLGSIATLIPQEADVFEASVRDNLSLSGEHGDAEIMKAARLSAFDDVMAEMGLTLEMPLSERGANLSGGQRQRLCLARGLLAAHGRSLVFLDEPTSALDPITEETVLARITAALPDACIVASIHRMNLLRHFDKVVLMANGRIQDVGTVEDLLLRQPAFREMLRQDARDETVTVTAPGMD